MGISQLPKFHGHFATINENKNVKIKERTAG